MSQSTEQNGYGNQNGFHNEQSSVSGPRSLAVVQPNEENHTFSLNVDILEKILLNPKIADKKVRCSVLFSPNFYI